MGVEGGMCIVLRIFLNSVLVGWGNVKPFFSPSEVCHCGNKIFVFVELGLVGTFGGVSRWRIIDNCIKALLAIVDLMPGICGDLFLIISIWVIVFPFLDNL